MTNLLDILRADGLVDEAGIAKADRLRRDQGLPLATALVRAGAATVPEEQVTKAEWTALLAGRPSDLVDAVHDPDDPEPAYDVLWGELTGGLGYRCAC